jgi:excinuclease ABC subunit A
LYARAGEAYSYQTGEKMIKFSEEQIIESIIERFDGQKIILTSPIVKSRKGHYRELFEQIKRRGFSKVIIDGQMVEIHSGLQLDRYKIHDIDIVIDRLDVKSGSPQRLHESVKASLKAGDGYLSVIINDVTHPYSRFLMDPTTGLSYNEPQPNSFSFNSPYGACTHCEGLGTTSVVNMEFIIPDKTKSINKGAIIPIGEVRENWTFQQLREVAKRLGFSLADPIEKLTEIQLNAILNGVSDAIDITITGADGKKRKHETHYKGVVKIVTESYFESDDDKLQQWAEEFIHQVDCEVCHGNRLKIESLHYKIAQKLFLLIHNIFP